MKKNLFLFFFLPCLFLTTFISCGEGKNPDTSVPVAAMGIEPSSVENMQVGETKKMSIKVIPENATLGALVWESSNTNVVSVQNDGTITAIGYGTTTVKVVNIANAVEATCQISVAEPKRTYELIWSDEFNDANINANKWNIETGGGGWGNKEAEYYTGRPENLRIENGNLIIEAKKENYQSNSYTSARITTKDKMFVTYGKVEARISLPSGQGTWPAFWMMPNKSVYGYWPRSGEIDIMEHVGSQPTMISNAVHTQQASGGNSWSNRVYYNDAENNFHVYAIEWVDNYNNGNDAIIFYVDGVQTAIKNQGNYLTSTYSDWPFDKDFYVILNLAIGGNWGGTINDNIFNNKVQMLVDYVKMYKQK